mmetsp:Transcript_32606/g.74777  ORF Transcript_32606/g.74777 Transcript_32606/m.74777 type:complete len:122 (+) Transcript_32606:47-412(+)
MAVPAVQITTPQSLLNGTYEPRASSDIPQAFRTFCAMMAWEAEHMWVSWTTDHGVWYETANGAFLYWNVATIQWWIVGPSGISECHGQGNGDDPTSVTEWTTITGKRISVSISITDTHAIE